MTRPLKDIAADLAALAAELDSGVLIAPDSGFSGEPTVEALFGTEIYPGARAGYDAPEMKGEQLISFYVDEDIKQVGFRYAGSSEASVFHLRDISLEILDEDLNALTNKLGTYAGLRGPAYKEPTRRWFGAGNWSRGTGDYRENLPKVKAGKYYLRITQRIARPVPLILEVV